MTAERASRRTAALVALALTALAALVLRQDANWDLRNYHLYTPLAWLDGRLDRDIAAAQLQSWYNPVADLPFALLVRAGAGGWLVSLWLALPTALALFFALRLLDALMPAQRSRLRSWMAGLVAITGAAVYPGTAATFNDQFVAALVLGGLWWMVAARARHGDWAVWLPIGLLGGLAAGVKLTAAMYCAAFIAAAVAAGPLRRAPVRLAALAAGGLAGAALGWGPWAWRLWSRHGNPLFPYFNQWFGSPDAALEEGRDLRFVPHNLWEALDAPLRLLRKSNDFSEASLADARVMLGLLALAGWVWWRARRAEPAAAGRRAHAEPATGVGLASAGLDADALDAAPEPPQVRAPHWPVLAFALSAYAIWLGVYSIYRYLYALELLFSMLIVGVLSLLFARRWARTGLVMGALLAIAPTKHPGWGRDPFQAPMIQVAFPALPADSLVLTSTQEPIGHAVPFLPPQVAVLGVHNNFTDPQRCTRLQSKIEQRIAEHRGPLWLLRPLRFEPAQQARIALYGLRPHGRCLPVRDNLAPIELCPLAREPFAPICR